MGQLLAFIGDIWPVLTGALIVLVIVGEFIGKVLAERD